MPEKRSGAHILVGRPIVTVDCSEVRPGGKKHSRTPSQGSTQQQDNDHTPSGWGCKIEWFDRKGRSLGYAPKSLPGWTSSDTPQPSQDYDSSQGDQAATSSQW
jgi:hypothetical protein